MFPGGPYPIGARGINNSGEIVGQFGLGPNGALQGFLYSAGTYTLFPTPTLVAFDQALLQQNPGQFTIAPAAIPAAPGVNGDFIVAINNDGEVLGENDTDGYFNFLYDINTGSSTPLNLYDPADLNDEGESLASESFLEYNWITGNYTTFDLTGLLPQYAVVYSLEGIDDSGDVAGFFRIERPAGTPEPRGEFFLGLALLVLGGMALQRRQA